MNDMEKVLAECQYAYTEYDDSGTAWFACKCGVEQQEDDPHEDVSDWHAQHVAQTLIAAGYRKPEPIDSDEVSIMNGWLVQNANECTCGAGPNLGMGHERGCGYEPLMNITEPLEQAGYTLNRKPRTITTAEELDALPQWSAILDSQGDVAQKLNGRWHFPETAPMGASKVLKYGASVTVLHEPAQ